MPRQHKIRRFEERIIAKFPKAEDLAWDRLFLTHKKTFFDPHSRKKINPDYSDELIFASLWLANYYAHQGGFKMDLAPEEKRRIKKSFHLKLLR